MSNHEPKCTSLVVTGSDYVDYMQNAFHCMIDEDPPRMLSFGLHNRIVAHPGRAFGLAKVLDWLANHSKVWLARRVDIATHWRKEHPPRWPTIPTRSPCPPAGAPVRGRPIATPWPSGH